MKKPPMKKLTLDEECEYCRKPQWECTCGKREVYNSGRQDMIDFLPTANEISNMIIGCREYNSVNETLLIRALIQRLEVDDA